MMLDDRGTDASLRGGPFRSSFKKPATLPVEIARHLREAIIRGEIRPGGRLNEVELTRSFALSRAPVREALRILQAEGLVDLKPRRGAFVRTLSVDGLWQLFGTRLMFESYAISRAELTLTDERIERMGRTLGEAKAALLRGDSELWHRTSLRFHDELIGLAANEFLLSLYELIKTAVRRYQVMLTRIEGQPARSQADHERILEALTRRDFPRAIELLRTHLGDLEKVLVENIEENH